MGILNEVLYMDNTKNIHKDSNQNLQSDQNKNPRRDTTEDEETTNGWSSNDSGGA